MSLLGKSDRGGTVVVNLGNVTYLDLPADRLLEAAKEHVDGAVIIGFNKEGELYFASSYADAGTVLWLMEAAKKALMEVEV